ncbi:MAG: porin, partial [Betaproteobacteria bacterium]|nr:porin [Betaproteobacteria bacterium]
MQERLIALVVMGLLASPSFAQSSVTLYGSLDYGFTNLGHHIDDNVKSRNGIDSSITKSNRLGFKGTEDLGDGLKAVFVLETGLNGDYGPMWKDSNARQSYAGLAGSFGTVAFGRQYAPQYTFIGAVDPFSNSGLGAAGNAMIQQRRLNNLAAYISPNWSGFSFIAAYTLAGTADETLENNGDVRIWVFAPSFTMDNLFVAGNYQSARRNRDNPTATPSQNVMNAWDLFASYDFGFVKLGSSYGKRTTKDVTPNPKFTQWMLGATFKVTPNDKILTS